MKFTGILGIITTVIFILGFTILFCINPQIIKELEDLSITWLNIVGLYGHKWAAIVCYLVLGILQCYFLVRLMIHKKTIVSIVVSTSILLIVGIDWFSLGVIPTTLSEGAFSNLSMIRILIIILLAPIGLIIIGIESTKIIRSNFLKYYTLFSGIILLLILIYGLVSWNFEFGVLVNLALVIYFIWFGVYGLKILKHASL